MYPHTERSKASFIDKCDSATYSATRYIQTTHCLHGIYNIYMLNSYCLHKSSPERAPPGKQSSNMHRTMSINSCVKWGKVKLSIHTQRNFGTSFREMSLVVWASEPGPSLIDQVLHPEHLLKPSAHCHVGARCQLLMLTRKRSLSLLACDSSVPSRLQHARSKPHWHHQVDWQPEWAVWMVTPTRMRLRLKTLVEKKRQPVTAPFHGLPAEVVRVPD